MNQIIKCKLLFANDDKKSDQTGLCITYTRSVISGAYQLCAFVTNFLTLCSTRHGFAILKEYILSRLVHEEATDRTESAIVVLVWLARLDEATYKTLSDDLDVIRYAWPRSLQHDAANAAVLVLWGIIDGSVSSTDDAGKALVCRAALNTLFSAVGDRNTARIQRTLMHCHLNLTQWKDALEIWDQIAACTRTEPTSLFVRYRIALQSGDDGQIDKTGQALVSCREAGPELLIASASETIQYNTKSRAARFMQRALDRFDRKTQPVCDIWALLRATARLHLSVLEETSQIDYELLSMLCGVFRSAVLCFEQRSADESRRVPNTECVWFEKIGYNAVLQNAKTWPTKISIDILHYCMGFQNSHDASKNDTRLLYEGNVCFLQATLYATAARQWTQTNTIEDVPCTSYHAREPPDGKLLQHHLYQNVLQRYHKLRSMFDPMLLTLASVHTDNQGKAANAFVPAFEAQIFLCQHEVASGLSPNNVSLLQLIDDLPHLTESPKAHACIGDLILSATIPQTNETPSTAPGARLPLQTAIAVIARLLALFRESATYNNTQAARWIRCIVQMILDAEPPVTTSTVTNPVTKPSDAQPLTTTTTSTTVNNATLDLLAPVVIEAISIGQSAIEAAAIYLRHHGTSSNHEAMSRLLYPSDELHWLATMIFNLAVDLHFAGHAAPASEWAGYAIRLADVLTQNHALEDRSRKAGGNGGSLLAEMLREKAARAGWDVAGV